MNPILKLLHSVKFGLLLLATLTGVCIWGSVISADAERGPDHAKALIFNTAWFIGLMGLFLVNLCLASWESSFIALTLYRKRNFQRQEGFFRGKSHAFVIPWAGGMDELARRFGRNYTVVHRDGEALYAQRGLSGRTGATIIHLGLLWTMGAGFYRVLADEFGAGVFDATVILPEGQASNSFFTRIDRLKGPTGDNLDEHKMPFSVRCLDFTSEKHPGSAVASRFAALVELRDGDHSEIAEVTMREPLEYKGYKITQNSFSDNERIKRPVFRVTDTRTGRFADLDANPGDPVKLAVAGAGNYFLNVSAAGPGASYRVEDLGAGKVVQEGVVEGGSTVAAGPLPVDLSPMARDLASSRYALLVAALFPNFTFDENRKPTTKDDRFDNPAALVLVFKNGKPNGYAWIFRNAEAQKIIGFKHPEVALSFEDLRKRAGADGSSGLFDYEISVKATDKATSRVAETLWMAPGKVTELAGMPASVMAGPNVQMEGGASPAGAPGASAGGISPHGEFGAETPTSAPLVAPTETQPSGGAGPPAAAGGNADPATPQGAAGPYRVVYLGDRPGQVTFLGFMRDPSVPWLYAGCMIVVGGTLMAFVIGYREAWGWYDEATGQLYLATQIRGTSPAAHRRFERFVAELAAVSAEREALIPPALSKHAD